MEKDVKRALVVDSDKLNLYLVSEYLMRLGYNPEILTDKNNVLKHAKEQRPNIILWEVNYKNDCDQKVLSELKIACNSSRIILITAHSEFEIYGLCQKSGIQEYINKPMIFNQFKTVVNSRQKGYIKNS